MASVHLIRSSRVAHAEYADAAVVDAGHEVVVLAGVCPLDQQGVTVGAGDVAAQMRQTLANLEMVLADCGIGLADIASVRILVATQRREDLTTAWTAFRAHVDHEVPATLTGVTVLGYADQLVELEVTAARAPEPAR